MHLPRAHFIRKEGGVPSGLNMRKKRTNATLYKSNRNKVNYTLLKDYSCHRKHAQSLNQYQCTSSHSQHGPGEYTAYLQTQSVSFKSSLLYYSASCSKVQVSAPSIAVLTHPSSCTDGAYLVFYPGPPIGKALGRFFYILCIQADLALCW